MDAILLQLLIGPVGFGKIMADADKGSASLIAGSAMIATPFGVWALAHVAPDNARVVIAVIAIAAFLLGFSSGLPLALTSGTLQAWATVCVALGRADEAMTVQRRGWRMIADEEHMVEQVATHLLVLARSRAVDRGLDILAKYTIWSVGSGRPEALHDALALRLAALEAADVVFRVCHQLHGAVGFCDETTLSWLSRYSQPLRRLPIGLSATRDVLTRAVGRRGLTGLYA